MLNVVFNYYYSILINLFHKHPTFFSVSCMFLQKNHCADTNFSENHNNITSNSSSLKSSFNNSNNSSLFISDSNRNSLKYENIKEEIADLQKDFATVKNILVETIDKEKETVIELRELDELRRELNQLRREIARNKEKDGTENIKIEENWIRESIVELRRELTEVESKVEEQGSCSPDPSLLLRLGQLEKVNIPNLVDNHDTLYTDKNKDYG